MLSNFSLDIIISLFKNPSKNPSELESLIYYLNQFQDMRRYFAHYNLEQQCKIVSSFTLLKFYPNQLVFNKGDPSDIYYFVIDGQLEVYNQERDGSTKLVGIVGPGKSIGERGVLRGQPRSLACITKTQGYFLVMSSETFLALFSSDLKSMVEQKLKFIESYFPNVKKLTTVQKERISYAMGYVTMSKGQAVSSAGEKTEILCFISEGECIVNLSNKNRSMILKLAAGNLIGEEGVLFNTNLKYNISVSSEYLQIYTMKKQDVYFLLPPETIDAWKKNFRAKDYSRKQLVSGLSLNSASSDEISRTYSHFKLASGYAGKRLNAIQRMSEKNISVCEIRKNEEIEKTLKLFSPAAVIFKGRSSLKRKKINGYVSGKLKLNVF